MARAMLLSSQWDVDRLQQRYFDNPEKTIKDLFNIDWNEVDERLKQNQTGPFICPVCCEETSNPVIMECAHGLCRDCFTQYLSAQMTDGPEAVFTKCPIHPCKLLVSDELFRELLDPEIYKKYEEYYKNTFIGMNKRTKWCPSPGCNRAVDYPSMKQTDIVCNCGHDWCFKCARGAHRPIACDLL